jgi:hypothetical protein
MFAADGWVETGTAGHEHDWQQSHVQRVSCCDGLCACYQAPEAVRADATLAKLALSMRPYLYFYAPEAVGRAGMKIARETGRAAA